MPLRHLGGLTTTIFMGTSFLSAQAGAAAADQQKCHEEQKRSHRKDRGDEDARSQRQRAQAQVPAPPAAPSQRLLSSDSLSVYTARGQLVTGCDLLWRPKRKKS